MAATRNRESRDITVAFVYYVPVCDVAIPPLLGKRGGALLLKPVFTDENSPIYTRQEFEECDELYARHGYTLLYASSGNFSEKLFP